MIKDKDIKEVTINGYGYFEYSIEYGKFIGEKRKTKRLRGKTKKEVKEKYVEFMTEIERNSIVTKNNATFCDYLEKYDKLLKRKLATGHMVTPTYERYERMWRLHIVPAIGKKLIQKINKEVIQNFIDGLNMKRKPINLLLTILNGVFKIAIDDKIIKESPVRDLLLPQYNKKKSNVWNKEQIETFLSYGENINKRGKYYVAILMAIFTGMRKGEILGLTWDKIDFEKNIIIVDQIKESNHQKIVERIKERGEGGYKEIPLSSIIKEELLRHKEFQKKDSPKNPMNLVFCTRTGNIPVENTINDVLNKYCKLLELPRITVHDTRHTNASMSFYLGGTVLEVQQQLNHTKASMTLDVYSHFIPKENSSLAKRWDEAFERDKNVTKKTFRLAKPSKIRV